MSGAVNTAADGVRQGLSNILTGSNIFSTPFLAFPLQFLGYGKGIPFKVNGYIFRDIRLYL